MSGLKRSNNPDLDSKYFCKTHKRLLHHGELVGTNDGRLGHEYYSYNKDNPTKPIKEICFDLKEK